VRVWLSKNHIVKPQIRGKTRKWYNHFPSSLLHAQRWDGLAEVEFTLKQNLEFRSWILSIFFNPKLDPGFILPMAKDLFFHMV
jgi:hypothetical protein